MRRPLLAAALLVGLFAVGGSVRAETANLIQPGAEMRSEGAGCTANFVYDGVGPLAGRTFVGTAAHCVTKLGDDVTDGAGQAWGDVAWIGDAGDTALDFAFVEVRDSAASRVSPVVKGHEAPTGWTTEADVATGDTVQLSGYGMGFGLTQLTQEGRFGTVTSADSEMYSVAAPIIYGDSGGPVVHSSTGKALGIVSRLCLGVCTEEGPTVEGILTYATSAGFPVALRTA